MTPITTAARCPTRRAPTPRMKGLEGGLRARAGHIGREAAEVDLDLVPGVRDRLHARLVAMGIPATKEVSYVAGITQRAAQSVRRWFDAREPGLPDLESFARLCIGLGCSADEIIGALHREGHDPARCAHMVQMANCIRAITDSLTRRGELGIPVRVPGDEMAQRLKAGDIVFVKTAITRIEGNGIYAFTRDDELLIRRVEQRIDKSIVLQCDNKAYRDHEWKGAAAAARSGVKLLGKVHGGISVQVF